MTSTHKYLHLLLFGLIIFLSVQATAADGMVQFTGSVTTFEDVTVEGMLYSDANPRTMKTKALPAEIKLWLKNQAGVNQHYKVPLTDVEKIIFDDNFNENKIRVSCVIVLKNGKNIQQVNRDVDSLLGRVVYVSSRDPITGGLSYARLNLPQIKEIRFHEPFGQVRKDELGHIFPADYEYSPFTGKPMQLQAIY